MHMQINYRNKYASAEKKISKLEREIERLKHKKTVIDELYDEVFVPMSEREKLHIRLGITTKQPQ